MVSTIKVVFQGHFSHVGNVLVPVEVVDSSLDIVAETTVALGSFKPVVVSAPGLYLVRAALPSGERVTASVTVPHPSAADPNPSATATLSPRDPSPRETSAWAYTVQGVQRAGASPRLRAPALALESAGGGPSEEGPPIGVTPAHTYRNQGASDGVFGLERDLESSWTPVSLTGDPRVVLHLEIRRPLLDSTDPTEWRPYYQDFTVSSGSHPVRLLVAVPPIPESQIVLVRNESDSVTRPVRPLIRGGDPRADALLSYLTQGAFADARAIGSSMTESEIQDILYRKRKDPASAVVSVYYQLRAGSISHPDWVKNLADWFPPIPDGAVQYGWCILRQATPDHDAARSYFLTAVRRGIPIYSYGVRLLYDGLNLFAERNPSDIEVANAFRAVRRLAAAIDWQAPVTSLTVDKDSTVVALVG